MEVLFALCRALMDVPGIDAKAIAMKAMKIASDMCVFTNGNFMMEICGQPEEGGSSGSVLAPGARDFNPLSKP